MEYWCISGLVLSNLHCSDSTEIKNYSDNIFFFFLVGNELFSTLGFSYATDETLLVFRYSIANIQTSSVILLTQTFTTTIKHLLCSHWQIAIHSLRVPLIKSKFHLDSFFIRYITLWNRLFRRCFHDKYNHNLFKSWVNKYISYISS